MCACRSRSHSGSAVKSTCTCRHTSARTNAGFPLFVRACNLCNSGVRSSTQAAALPLTIRSASQLISGMQLLPIEQNGNPRILIRGPRRVARMAQWVRRSARNPEILGSKTRACGRWFSSRRRNVSHFHLRIDAALGSPKTLSTSEDWYMLRLLKL